MGDTYQLHKGEASLLDLVDGSLAMGAAGAKSVYYVDNNAGSDGNDGSSWEYSMKTLSATLALSHADIASGASGWAARNVIFFKGDQSADADGENLVLLAQKTDIIGVGSTSQYPQSTLVGAHVPISATGIGVRFINVRFKCPAAGGSMFTLNATQRGIEFINCTFDATNTAAATSAIIATAVWFLKIKNCRFVGPFAGTVISIAAGNARGLDISDNYIEGAAAGISLATGVTSTPDNMLVARNTMRVGAVGITDTDETLLQIVDNRVTTTAAKGSAGVGAIIGNEYLAMGNLISASDLVGAVWPVLGTV